MKSTVMKHYNHIIKRIAQLSIKYPSIYKEMCGSIMKTPDNKLIDKHETSNIAI